MILSLIFSAFPCNQFGSQEPGSNEEIKQTVFDHYKARFRLMDKVDVQGAAVHPVWQYLTSNSKVVPQWNFYKYLIDNHGNIVNVWPPQTSAEVISKNYKLFILNNIKGIYRGA